MDTCGLPGDASLEHLRKQAKELQRRARAGDADAIELVGHFHPGNPVADLLRRSDAQLVVARRYGFGSWPRLVAHFETVARFARAPHRAPVGALITDAASLADEFLRLACLTYGADDPARLDRARVLLDRHPELASVSIHAAAAIGDVEVAEALLAHDATLARTRGGPHQWEPLLYLTFSRVGGGGCGRDPLRTAALLLAQGADANAGYLWGGLVPPFTALTGAFGGGEDAPNQRPHRQASALARLLLDHGADPNDGQTLYNRHFEESDEHLQLLFAYGLGSGDGGPWRRRLTGRLDTPREMLEDQLLFAAAHDYPRRVELLLDHGVDADGLGTRHPILRGQRAIELATANGAVRIVALLAAAGAALVELDPVDEFLAACMSADRDRVEALVEAAPSLPGQAVERDPGRIVEAAELGRREAIRLLVELGWDVNTRTRGRTALHEAAYHDDRDLVEVLLALGADPTIRDSSFDATAAGWASHAHHDQLAADLAERESAQS